MEENIVGWEDSDHEEIPLKNKNFFSVQFIKEKGLRIYSFDKALRSTINKKFKSDGDINCFRKYWLIITFGAMFQVFFLIASILVFLLGAFLEFGLIFFEKEPSKFYCNENGEW